MKFKPTCQKKQNFSFRLLSKIERMLKIYVILGDAFLSIHCIMLTIGWGNWMSELAFGTSLFGFTILWATSYLLKLCWRFRACLAHNLMVSCCMTYQREYGFDENVNIYRIIMASSGCFFVTANIINYIKNKNRKTNVT